jgi:hypothetical protein
MLEQQVGVIGKALNALPQNGFRVTNAPQFSQPAGFFDVADRKRVW